MNNKLTADQEALLHNLLLKEIGYVESVKACTQCKYHSTKDEGFHHVCNLFGDSLSFPLVISGTAHCDNFTSLTMEPVSSEGR